MDSSRFAREVRWLACIVIAALAVVGAASIIGGNTRTITKTQLAAPAATAVDGPDSDTKRDDALPLDNDAQEMVEDLVESDRGDVAGGHLRGVDRTEAGVIAGPLAAQEFPGCRTAFVRNFSQRNAAVRYITWHETVSRENGLSSQNALTARANDPRTQVSWHLLIARKSGLCTFTVPLPQKAWHVGNGNSVSVGIEVEADGSERSYVEGAGKDKLFAVTARIAAIYGIPLRHGTIRFDGRCNPIGGQSGILEHRDYGLCGGGHLDVCSSALCHSGGPESAERLSWQIGPLIRELAQRYRPPSKTNQVRCRKVHWYREYRRRTTPGARSTRRFSARLAHVRKRGLRCVDGKAVRRR